MAEQISANRSLTSAIAVRRRQTFSVETRSAVSSSVSWLIWSTMPLILGLTASVELNRLVVAVARSACAETRAEEMERSWRAQLCAAYRHDMAMFVDGNWKIGRFNSNLGGSISVACVVWQGG